MSIIYINSYQFAPPAGPTDPNFSNVSLLLHGDSTPIVDSSPSPKAISVFGNAQVSTAQSKFGGASLLFDGNGDRLETPHSTDFVFGSGAFTIEYWLRTIQINTTGNGGTFISHRTGGGATNTNFIMQVNFPTSNKISFYASDGATYQINGSTFQSTTSVNDGVWHHIAVTRSGSTFRLFIDGIIESTATWAGSIASTSRPLLIGWDNTVTANYFDGYIDDLRITKGVARYTANFTPPTAPFPDA